MSNTIKNLFTSKSKNKVIFYILSITLLMLMLIFCRDAGISGDEHFKVDHAELVFNYFKTLGKDSLAANTPLPLQKYNGQSFDNVVYMFNRFFGIESIYESRHFFNAFVGWLLIFFTGLTASFVFGWNAGILAIILMTFSPVILGHSWNNPKDIPFAFFYIFALFFLFRFLKELPKIKISTAIGLGAGIAGAISIRIGGLIIIPYMFLFVGIYYLMDKEFYSKDGFSQALKTIGILSLIGIGGYFLGLILWPYGLESPLKNPFKALHQMTNYKVILNQLFEGQILESDDAPWYYGIKYILIKSPIVIFVGIIAFATTLIFRKELKLKYLFYTFLFFAFAFPVAYTIYKHSNLYGGWRHLLWTYSPIVILSAGGFDYLLKRKQKYIKYGALLLIALLLIHPVKHTIKNHPYEYIYYNQLGGGVDGAYGNYEMDYYYHSLKGASDWFIQHKMTSDSITIATNHIDITEYYFRKYPNVHIVYSRYYEKSSNQWDYAIWANTNINPYQLKKNLWPPKKTLHTVYVDDVPVAAVVKRISDEDFKGFEALKKNQLTDAEEHFRTYLKLYPQNEEALAGMASTLFQEKKYHESLAYADSSLHNDNRQLNALVAKINCYNKLKQYQDALSTCNELLAIRKSIPEAHFLKGVALKGLNQPNEALKEFQVAINFKKDYYKAYMRIGDILTNYKKYDEAISGAYQKILEFKKNDFQTLIRIAKCYHFLKNNQKAEQILNQIKNDQNKTDFELVKLETRIALDHGNVQEAFKLLRMAAYVNNKSDLDVIRSLYMVQINSLPNARKFATLAVEEDPYNNEAIELNKRLQPRVNTTAKQSGQNQQSIMFQKNKQQKSTSNPLKMR